MADEKKAIDSTVELSAQDLQALDPKVLSDLQAKHGLEIQVRSNSAAINTILTGLGRPGLTQAEFTRGFDRTSPGYDKYYNRDFKMMDPLEQVTLPADKVNAMSLSDALKTLSVEQLTALKKQRG